MRIFLQKSSIEYKSQRWLWEGVAPRRGSELVNHALSRTLTMGQIAKSAVFHCENPGSLGESPVELASYNAVYHNVQHATPAGYSSCSAGGISQPTV